MDEQNDELKQEEQPQENQEQQVQEENKKEETQEQGSQKQENIEEKLEEKGFDYSKLEEEYFNNNGELSKETKEKLNSIGISDEFINDFINGKKAIYEQEINDLSESVGGREQYDSLIEWAGKNLDANTIQAVNNIRDKSVLKDFILPKLKEMMEEKEGQLPEITLKGNTKSQETEVFESQSEMFAAIRDPRYQSDKAYQTKVTAKIRASREAGIDLGI